MQCTSFKRLIYLHVVYCDYSQTTLELVVFATGILRTASIRIYCLTESNTQSKTPQTNATSNPSNSIGATAAMSHQSMTTARDIPIVITSSAASSERRITPSWTIAHLKTKLEPVTGIAPSSQILTLRLPDRQQETPIEAEDEESVEIGRWPLVAYAEIKVCSWILRPQTQRASQ